MALKFSMILEAVDRVTAPARKMRSSVSQLTAGIRRWGQDVRRVSQDIENGSRSLDHYQRRARRLRQVAIGSVFRAASLQARRFASDLRAGIRNLDLMARAGRGAGSGLKWLGGKALGFAGGAAKWAFAGASAFASLSIFDLFRTGGQFEQYQVMLEGTEGSVAKAKKAMGWVQKFAADTPYELNQVMEAFIKLKAYGIDPMNGSLSSLGDGAAGMSKDIDQAVEALADAVSKEYERLKEFGIRASKASGKVTFTYLKNGKEISRTVKENGVEIEKAITGIFSDRFGGGMARQSKTLFGIISNLKDKWSGFLVMVANAGIFDKVKAKLDSLLAMLDQMAQNGSLQIWAQKISDYLGQAFDWGVKFVQETDWVKVGQDLKTIADAALTVADAIKSMKESAERYQAVVRNMPIVGPTMRAIDWLGNRGGDNKPAANPSAPVPNAPSNWWNRPTVPNLRNPQIRGRTSAAAPVQVGGAIQVDVRVQGPGSARVTRVTSNNPSVPVQANTGKIMDGAA